MSGTSVADRIREMRRGLEYIAVAVDDSFRAKTTLMNTLRTYFPEAVNPVHRRQTTQNSRGSSPADGLTGDGEDPNKYGRTASTTTTTTSYASGSQLRGRNDVASHETFAQVAEIVENTMSTLHYQHVQMTQSWQDAIDRRMRVEAELAKIQQRRDKEIRLLQERIEQMKSAVHQKVQADADSEAHLSAVESSLDKYSSVARAQEMERRAVQRQIAEMRQLVRQKLVLDEEIETSVQRERQYSHSPPDVYWT